MEHLGYTLEYRPLNASGWDKLKASTIDDGIDDVKTYFLI